MHPGQRDLLHGYQDVAVTYSRSARARLAGATYGRPGGSQRRVPAGAIRHDADADRFVVCVECVRGTRMSIRLEFGRGWKPIVKRYRTRHAPKVVVRAQATADPAMARLNAGASRSAGDAQLRFRWLRPRQRVVAGPRLTVPLPERGLLVPVLLRVYDGPLTFNATVFYGPERQPDGTYRLVARYKPDRLKCTALKIEDKGDSVLNPAVPLGPVLKQGDSVTLDAGGKTKAATLFVYRFEARATVVPDASSVLLEGQDVAGTSLNPAESPSPVNRKGRVRRTHKPDDLGPDEVEAPFPDKPSGTAPPTLAADDYQHHPASGVVLVRTDAGDIIELGPRASHAKDFGQDPADGSIGLMWFDAPGIVLPKGTDLSKGAFYRAYFEAWMDPDYAACHKRFTVDLELDKTGKVTKSELVALALK